MRPGFGAPRIQHGNTAAMRSLHPALGLYFLNDDTGHIHQWNGLIWESIGGNGTPEKDELIKKLERQQMEQAAYAGVGGGGSSPGLRGPGDPSIDDPVIFVAPPAGSAGGLEIPTLVGGRGDGRSTLYLGNTVAPPVFSANFDYTSRDVATSWQAYSDGSATDKTITQPLNQTWNPDPNLRSRRYVSWVVPALVRFASLAFTPTTGDNVAHNTESYNWELHRSSYGVGTPAYATGESDPLLTSGGFPWSTDVLRNVAVFPVTAGGYLQLYFLGVTVNPVGLTCSIRPGAGNFLGKWWT